MTAVSVKDHLVGEDLRLGMLVSFSHRGKRRLGKVAAAGRAGARVLSGWWVKDNEPDPMRRRMPNEFLVPYAALRSAAWPGSTVATRSGHTLLVQSVNGPEVEGIVTTKGYPGNGQVGLVYANEIVAVHHDDETWDAT